MRLEADLDKRLKTIEHALASRRAAASVTSAKPLPWAAQVEAKVG